MSEYEIARQNIVAAIKDAEEGPYPTDRVEVTVHDMRAVLTQTELDQASRKQP